MPNNKFSPQNSEETIDGEPVRRLSRRAIVLLTIGVLLFLGGACASADWWFCLPDGTKASYVGSKTCIECHADQSHAWKGSHHDLAMDWATSESVLGDFNNAEIEHFGVRSRMFRNDEKFMVHTEGPDGKMADFQVKYVFGFDPLQQYMVEFDRDEKMTDNEVGQLQVLRISWDTHRKKWFHLDPPRTDESPDEDEKLQADDELHWTGIAQRWNTMCAECHSTNLKKNYDVKNNKYHTSFSEIDVSCEACHGPGSTHIKLANNTSLFWDRKLGYGLANLKSQDSNVQIQACAQCHARQSVVHPDFQPGKDYYDYFSNTLLLPGVYHPDGQVQDEDYVFGSFLQSKMYHKGIRCTDCHDPHTTKLKHEGNKLCTSCHQHPAGKYDSYAHHRHKPGSKGASCVECHMPETTYMTVDSRRDHSLRVPRPDLSVALGTPNACTRCHLEPEKLAPEKTAPLTQYADWLAAARRGDEEIKSELTRLDRWSAEAIEKWYGKKPDTDAHFASIFAKVWNGDADASDELITVIKNKKLSALVRASAVFQLSRYSDENCRAAAQRALSDMKPQVRAAAVRYFQSDIPNLGNLENLSENQQAALLHQLRPAIKLLTPLLSDSVRLVRTEVAMILSSVPPQISKRYMSGAEQEKLDTAFDELVQRLMAENDHAHAHLALGSIYENRGDEAKAIQSYQTAIGVEPRMLGSRRNLAATLEQKSQRLNNNMRRHLFSLVDRRFSSPMMQQRLASLESIEDFYRTLEPLLPPDQKETEPKVRQTAKQIEELTEDVRRLRREELDLLARRARLLPNSAESQYEYGLFLNLHGEQKKAEEALAKAHQLEPNTPQFLMALTFFYQKYHRWEEAKQSALRLIELRPQEPSYHRLLDEIRRQSGGR